MKTEDCVFQIKLEIQITHDVTASCNNNINDVGIIVNNNNKNHHNNTTDRK